MRVGPSPVVGSPQVGAHHLRRQAGLDEGKEVAVISILSEIISNC